MWKLANGYIHPLSYMFKVSSRNNKYQLPYARLDLTKGQIAYSCVALWKTEVPDNQQNEIKQITVQKSFAKIYKT